MSDSKTNLADGLSICRILNGMWQVSGAHGYIDPKKAIDEMIQYHNSGFTTWDLADIYGPAESFIGKFRKALEKLQGINDLNNSPFFFLKSNSNISNPDCIINDCIWQVFSKCER